MNFKDLNINKKILNALDERGFKSATAIQTESIPVAKKGRDVIALSKTGSGKTCAFGIPVLEGVIPGKGIQAIIIVPTRELVVQIAKELESFSKYLNIKVVRVFGGVSIDQQIKDIKKSEIVVGTPGRLLDHLERRTLNLSKIRYFVLDEADKMVEMGFVDDIERILSGTPKEKQILLFGATTSRDIQKIKKKMNNPKTITTDVRVPLLEQKYIDVQPHEKFSVLVHFLNNEKVGRAIVFCSKRSTVKTVYGNLVKQKIPCEMIHGKLTQNKRLKVIEDFNKGEPNILIASTVAARGLHIEKVTHIFNYDLPDDPQEYIHRVGRTARAGEKGIAITLLSRQDHKAFTNILRLKHTDVEKMDKPSFEKVEFDAGRFQRGHRGRHSRPGPRGWSKRHRKY